MSHPIPWHSPANTSNWDEMDKLLDKLRFQKNFWPCKQTKRNLPKAEIYSQSTTQGTIIEQGKRNGSKCKYTPKTQPIAIVQGMIIAQGKRTGSRSKLMIFILGIQHIHKKRGEGR